MIQLKRVYDQPSADDGFRVLVERLWPRGVTKEGARLDLWLKEIAPSPELRTWYAHDVARWEAFRTRYLGELADHTDALTMLHAKAESGTVTLVYAASDTEHNSARIVKEVLERPD
jgi:uncharacterized protein YeaO (DUF488 family)